MDNIKKYIIRQSFDEDHWGFYVTEYSSSDPVEGKYFRIRSDAANFIKEYGGIEVTVPAINFEINGFNQIIVTYKDGSSSLLTSKNEFGCFSGNFWFDYGNEKTKINKRDL